jgi:tetratricopeptide (TPR) repeat protein
MKSRWRIPVLVALFATVASAGQAQESYSEAGLNQYINRSDWRGLLGYTQAWTRAEPNNPVAWYDLGKTYGAGLNQPREAADALRRAVALRPQWPQAWGMLALNYNQSAQYEAAVAAAKQAIAQSADQPKYWNLLAGAYSNLPGHNEDVLATLREERQHMGQASADDWFYLGLAFDSAGSIMDHGPYGEAISAYTQSLNRNASNPMTWNNRGAAEQSLGNYAAALSDYQHASQLGLARGADNYNHLKQVLASDANSGTPGNGGTAPRCAPNLSYTPDGHHGMQVYCNTYASSPPAGAVLGGSLH